MRRAGSGIGGRGRLAEADDGREDGEDHSRWQQGAVLSVGLDQDIDVKQNRSRPGSATLDAGSAHNSTCVIHHFRLIPILLGTTHCLSLIIDHCHSPLFRVLSICGDCPLDDIPTISAHNLILDQADTSGGASV
jgi:hypothetical protein